MAIIMAINVMKIINNNNENNNNSNSNENEKWK